MSKSKFGVRLAAFVLTLATFFGLSVSCSLERDNVACELSEDTEPATNSSLEKPTNWVIVGSSSAAGAGAEGYQYSWAGLLNAARLIEGETVMNIARGGFVTYQALPTECEVSPLRPQPEPLNNVSHARDLNADVVVISFPSNDAAVGYSAGETVTNIIKIRDYLKQYGVSSVVLSSQPRPLPLFRRNALVDSDKMLSQELGECFVDIYTPLLGSDGRLRPEFDYDGVHLTRAGHQAVFEVLNATIQSGQCLKL